MATAVTPVRNKVVLDFGPQTPNPTPIKHDIVSLMFDGPRTVVNVCISERSLSDPMLSSLSEEGPTSIHATIYQIQNLTLRSIFLRESQLKPEFPDYLKVGQKYHLQILSEESSLKARFVNENARLLSDQAELLHLLGSVLHKAINTRFKEFQMEINSIPKVTKKITIGPDLKTKNIINSAIKKINTVVLKYLMKNIRASLSDWDSKTPSEQKSLSKKNFSTCFNIIGDEELIDIMRSALAPTAFKISIEFRISLHSLMNKISHKFKDKCLKFVAP